MTTPREGTMAVARGLIRVFPSWLAGMAISTPIIAILQGTLLLQEYRWKHGDAPRPDVPSRGVVVVGSSTAKRQSQPDGGGGGGSPTILKARTTRRGTEIVATSAAVASSLYPGHVLRKDSYSTVASRRQQEPPLRLLVIGDSLAAGVGTSRQGTPVMPESIATALSHAMQGRAVYWTCTGTPGTSARQIVQEIRELQEGGSCEGVDGDGDCRCAADAPADALATADNNRDARPTSPAELIERLKEWQAERRQRAQEQLEETRRRAQEWLDLRRQMQEELLRKEQEDDKDLPMPERVRKWFQRRSMQIQRDARALRRLIRQPDARHGEGGALPAPKQRTTTLIRRRTFDPALVGEFDIAIVLTGLNDLKEIFLPFMMSDYEDGGKTSPSRSYSTTYHSPEIESFLDDDDEETKATGGSKVLALQDQLVQVLHALQSKMKLALPSQIEGNENGTGGNSPEDSATLSASHIEARRANVYPDRQGEHHYHQDGPLVVFPALPFDPIKLSHVAPLCWFLVPLIKAMDRNKQALADRYPDVVVFVESPGARQFAQAEAGLGPLCEDSQRERVLLKLTDVAQNARERVERLMRQHYRDSWVLDADEAEDEEACYYTIEADYVNYWSKAEAERRYSYPGATMVASDGMHPNDAGYDTWGRLIARAIVAEWRSRH